MKNIYRIYVADLDILVFHEIEHITLWETLSDDAELIDVIMSAKDYERFDNYTSTKELKTFLENLKKRY